MLFRSPTAWRLGSIGMWIYKLRKLNGPAFTYPLLMFAGLFSEKRLAKMGKIYMGQPIEIKTRAELLATLKPNMLKHLREDCGDLPEEELARRAAVASAPPAAEAATV